MIKWILNKIVGSKNQREVRRLQPIVSQINEFDESFKNLSDEELIAKTREWQSYLHRFLPLNLPTRRIIECSSTEQKEEWASALTARFNALKSDFPTLPETVSPTFESIEEAKLAFLRIQPNFSKLREDYLNKILPQAYAVVKNASRRMCGKDVDVCGRMMPWEMVHFDVQLIGGIALHRGYIAEMATGEGKTLVATLPVYLNALTGMGVHVVTVNDYLAKRDSEWMGALFRFLGLSVGCIESQMPPYSRREMYAADITYGTNAEFGFDYLRDNGMANSREEQVQRGHYFAIIDEVDSILIDEARTPLIISGPAVVTREPQYLELCPKIAQLVKQQTELCNSLLEEGKELYQSGKIDEAGRNFFKVKLGQPRNKGLDRLLEDPAVRRLIEKTELGLYQDTRKRDLFALKEELYFTVDTKSHDADLMEKGRQFISPNDPDAFILPDLGTKMAEMDENPNLTNDDRERMKQELQAQLDVAGERMHATSQLLKAFTIYEKDKEYVVRMEEGVGKVVIIDQNTGREMPGRRWSDGLHQAVEAKEGVEVEQENQTYATITIQNYFRLYSRLSGMTGTAETEAAEFHDIYKLDVLPIPTNRECLRQDRNDLMFKTRREKYNAVVNSIRELHEKGQPILVGTASVNASETLSRMLRNANIPHEVLNAKNHQREAEIVALAGQKGAVTVSTNMAGRGTDIKLGAGVADLGGLFVLGTERHESRRIDRQLRGRCSRQGDPGGSQFYISFEDDLLRNFGAADRMTKMMERFGMKEGESLEHAWLNKSVETAQKRVEQRNYIWRKRVLDFDDVMNKQREVVYGYRNEVLVTEDPRELILEVIQEGIPPKVEHYISPSDEDYKDLSGLIDWANRTFPLGLNAEDYEKEWQHATTETICQDLISKVTELYSNKAGKEDPTRLDGLERNILLSAIDKRWQEHLYNMDALREGVHLRAQGQKDPLVEYKSEAYTLFESLMINIKDDALQNLFRSATSMDSFEEFLRSLPQFQQGGLDSLASLMGNELPLEEIEAMEGMDELLDSREPETQIIENEIPMQDPSLLYGKTDGGKKLELPKRKIPNFAAEKLNNDTDA